MKTLLRWAGAIALVLMPAYALAQTQLPPVKDWGGHTVPGAGTMIIGADGAERGTVGNPLVVTGGTGGGGGGGDASAANQTTQIARETSIRDQIGALSGPASGSTNWLLTDVRSALLGTLTVGTHAVTQSGAWSVGLAAGTTVTTSPLAATSTSAGGTIATANAYQSALAASGTRKGCLIVAKSSTVLSIYIGTPGAATAAASIDLQPGIAFSCVAGGMVIADQISIASATAGATYVVIAQ